VFDAEVTIAPSSLGTNLLCPAHYLSCWGSEGNGEQMMVVGVHVVEFLLGLDSIDFLSGWVAGVEQFVDRLLLSG
jgi:hypothetical protein